MSWLQVTARIPNRQAEALEQRLLELGATSVSFLDAGDEPVFQLDSHSTPLWQHTRASGLFEAGSDVQAVQQALATEFGLKIGDSLQLETLPDQDWERAWMDDFHPMRFGERLWICPSWTDPPDPTATNILLDPGLAFGSGTHPTTALCLEWLDIQAREGALQDCSVLDYGCGSGILAIAAALLGAGTVVGVDNDPQAVTATGNNRDLNGIDASRLSVHLPGEHPALAADIVIANILSGPLQELMPILRDLVCPGGRIVLSGVLSQQSEELIEHYRQDFDMEAPVVRDEWVRIEGSRPRQEPPRP